MFRGRLEAVSVCIGYGDILAETAVWNAPHFDKWVIVTSPDDEETREVCRRNRLTCLTTDDVPRDGEFSKGRLIERGLQQLAADAHILHIDADIAIPGRFRHELDRAHLKPDTIYGVDRLMLVGWDRWKALVKSGWMNHPYSGGHPHCVAPPKGLEVGARWAGADGWAPIGFFQLFSRLGAEEEWRGTRAKTYPLDHGNACRTDVQFAHLFDRRRRELLPEFYVVHLESEPCKTGANWRGRTTRRFGPLGGPAVVPVSGGPS